MNTDCRKPPFKTSFCDDYERLLTISQQALEAWSNRREQVYQLGLQNRDVGNELVRLQANFARAYAALQRHVHQCPLCQFVAKMSDSQASGARLLTSRPS